jgi:EAL domain-containing protein (putative c-di-GMP-specific phosphodiesterase class I)/GGDEF domain-containing protein
MMTGFVVPTPSVPPNDLNRFVHDIIDQSAVYCVYQPIICLSDGSIHGYEALLRGPEGSRLAAPLDLFAAAESVSRLFELESIARNKAIEGFIRQDLPGRLFLNLSPMNLLDPNFKSGETMRLIEQLHFDASRIVIEITEHQPIDDYQLLFDAVNHYRNMGFTVALDDLGEGNSSLRLWSEIKPNYVKLDKHFISTLTRQDNRYHFVKIISELAVSVGTRVIAEGVETESVVELLCEMGISLGQGYFFARPIAQPEKHISWSPKIKASLFVPEVVARYAKDIAKKEPVLQAYLTVAQAVELFLQHDNLSAMAVVSQNQVIGLVERRTLTDLFSSRFGRELNAKKPIARFLDQRNLVVSANTPLEIISKMITQRSASDAQGVFAITDNGCYLGLGYFVDVLRAITEVKIVLAQEANPLTGLPGNKAIQNAIQTRIVEQMPFVALYFDLDHFKAYNDFYGYEKGDLVLGALAQILRRYVRHDEFLGHIGGDDFILLWSIDDWQQRLLTVFDAFNDHLPNWYESDQIERGGFEGVDRYNQLSFFSLMSLSVGVIDVAANQFQYEHQLAQLASKAKKHAKSVVGNSWHLI